MPGTEEDRDLREQIGQIDSLLEEIGKSKDARAASTARRLVQVLLDLHSAGLERLLGRIAETGEAGLQLIDAAATQDEVISSVLLLHGLHPLSLHERVLLALEAARPTLRAHGGDVELLSIDERVVRLRLRGSCHGCPSSAVTLRQTIEQAIVDKAPDAAEIVVEGETAASETVSAATDALPARVNGRFALHVIAQ